MNNTPEKDERIVVVSLPPKTTRSEKTKQQSSTIREVLSGRMEDVF